jgi:hypothetical protein
MNSLMLVSESDDDGPVGLALIAGDDLRGGRVYMCDPVNHLIDVLDDAARPLFSFGGFGSSPGQFNTPVDLAIVPINGDHALTCISDAVLVVADRGNHRLQIFTLDGVHLASVDDASAERQSGWPIRAGWPYFRLGLNPCVRFPSRLRWRAPYIDVTSGVGGVGRVDLPVALLPDFHEWMRTAPLPVMRRAYQAFMEDPAGHSVPEHCLRRIARRTQAMPRAAVMSTVKR